MYDLSKKEYRELCDQRGTKQEERSLKMYHQLVVAGSFHVQQAYFILNSGVCHKASASKCYIFGTRVTELSPLLTTTSCCFLMCWQWKARDAIDASELICAHWRIWSWADWVPTYCHSSINLSLGVFHFLSSWATRGIFASVKTAWLEGLHGKVDHWRTWRRQFKVYCFLFLYQRETFLSVKGLPVKTL